MKISQNGIDLIKKYEGCVLKVYLDSVGVKTLGYGHTGADVNALAVGTPITQAQADAYLSSDLVRFETHVNKYNSKYNWSQNEFDAMVSFAFNIGSIDSLTASGTRSKSVIAEKIPLYNKAGGKVLSGLTKRRNEERDMFLGHTATSTAMRMPTLKIGSRGEDVKSIQIYLSALGYQVGNIDGIYGKQTASCVLSYQINNKLIQDSIWGPQCWNSVGK